MDDDRPRLSLSDLRRAPPALRLVFWGALINLVDLRVNGVDLVNDILGMTLVALGAWRLARLRVDATYRLWMRFAAGVALAGLLSAILELAPPSPVARSAAELVGLLEVAALTLSCAMMIRLSRAAELPDVAADWANTWKWFLWIEVGLLGLLRAALTLAWLSGGRFPLPPAHASAWIAALILFLGLLLVPWIRFFQSTSRLSDGLRLKAWRRTLSSRSRGAAT